LLSCDLVVHKAIDFKPGQLRCPSCLNLDIAPSLSRGFLDSLMAFFHRIPRHCRCCGRRFYIAARQS